MLVVPGWYGPRCSWCGKGILLNQAHECVEVFELATGREVVIHVLPR